jgi:hypothetical protein
MTATTCSFSPPSSATNSSLPEGREQILDHVDKLLMNAAPGRESLLALLQLCHPDLQIPVVEEPVAREKAFRAVKARLHPDKHSALAKARVTRLFQNVQTFYMDCCHALADEERTTRRPCTSARPASSYTRTSTTASTGSTRSYARRSSYHSDSSTSTSTSASTEDRTESPKSVLDLLEFDVHSKWSFLKQMPRETPFQAVSTSQLHHHVAYACLNQRGAIVHGQAIDCTYQVPVNFSQIETETEAKGQPSSIAHVWKQAGLDTATCTCTCTTIAQIKQEIAQYGPVVSVSFFLDPQLFYQQNSRHAGNFSERHVGQLHPLLIVGWTMTCTGQVWLVQALRGPTFSVGMGQFQIEACCLAPSPSILQQKCWQAPGPYWDVADLGNKCPDWKAHFDNHHAATTTTRGSWLEMIDIMPLASSDMEALGDLWTVGLNAVVVERRTFCLRDKQKLAHSRKVILRDMARVPYGDKMVWKVTLSVVRK